jgi:hypothetical protein
VGINPVLSTKMFSEAGGFFKTDEPDAFET